jgi:RNA 2',3'-cyclic 3'-phosphodiesterase
MQRATTRLFLALWPGPVARRSLLAWRDACIWPASAALVRPERLHMTLHFLGSVPSYRLTGLVHGLKVPFKRFDLQFGSRERWPHGLVVLRPHAVPEPLLELHTALAVTLSALSLPLDRSGFRPHVTLARRAAGAEMPATAPDFHWSVRGYVLACSMPGPLGGYRLLARYV